MRGSEQLTKEIRDASVTYERVVKNFPSEYLLSCGHYGTGTERNPAYLGQVRYCQQCTEANLRVTGEI